MEGSLWRCDEASLPCSLVMSRHRSSHQEVMSSLLSWNPSLEMCLVLASGPFTNVMQAEAWNPPLCEVCPVSGCGWSGNKDMSEPELISWRVHMENWSIPAWRLTTASCMCEDILSYPARIRPLDDCSCVRDPRQYHWQGSQWTQPHCWPAKSWARKMVVILSH